MINLNYLCNFLILKMFSFLIFSDFNFSERDLKSLVRCDMLTSGVDPKTQFSSYYAGHRFEQLRTKLSVEKSLDTLRLEMGFASKKVVEKLVW